MKFNESLLHLPAYDSEKEFWRVIIETPKGSQNKIAFDEKLGVFMLSGILPEGMSFPYDFGFLPSTLGDDGDPLDVLVLMDDAVFTGCMVPARLIGVIEAQQTEENGEVAQNDRLVAVPIKARTYSDCKSLEDLNEYRVHEIEQFFVSYNRIRDRKFKLLGLHGPARAETCAQRGMKLFQKKHKKDR